MHAAYTKRATILLGATLLSLGLFEAGSLQASESPGPHEDEPADTSRWHCSLCPYREGWYGALDLGVGHVDHSSLKYADYRGVDERGAYPQLSGDLHFRDNNGRYVDFHARDLGVDSRSLEARGGLRGHFQVRAAYREIPKYRGFGSATIFSGAGSTKLILPDDWQKSPTTEGMTGLGSSLMPAPLKTLRRTLQAGLTLKFRRKWTFDMDAYHETKVGTRPFGAGLYTINTSQFPAPVDFTTDRFEMGLQHGGERAHIRLGFAGSWFDNGADSVTWENPFSSPPGNQRLRAALAPDNTFYQFSLQGTFAPRPGIRMSGRAAWGRMRQDDPFLPYSINPEFSDLPLPRTTADTSIGIGTVNIAGKLVARLASRLDLTARAKFDRRDNHSPVDAYSIVITDFVPGGDRFNRPYSFDREKYDIELGYRAAPSVSLRVGSRLEHYKRTLQSVRETDERLYWTALNFSRWSAAQLRVRLETSKRDASPYRQVDETGLIENPLMRKFHFADRDRKRASVDLEFFPARPWSLNLSWSRAQDDYTRSLVGLRESDERNFSVDIGASLGPRISFNAFASRDLIGSKLSGFDAAAGADWDASTVDRTTTLGVGISGRLSARVDLGLDWTRSNSSGKISVTADPADQPFPVLRTRLGYLRGHISWAVNDHWAWKFFAEHERLSTSDWQIDGLGPGEIPNVLTLRGIGPHYQITAVRLQLSFRF